MLGWPQPQLPLKFCVHRPTHRSKAETVDHGPSAAGRPLAIPDLYCRQTLTDCKKAHGTVGSMHCHVKGRCPCNITPNVVLVQVYAMPA